MNDLKETIDNYVMRNQIYEMFSQTVNKLALNAFDDKCSIFNIFESEPLS